MWDSETFCTQRRENRKWEINAQRETKQTSPHPMRELMGRDTRASVYEGRAHMCGSSDMPVWERGGGGRAWRKKKQWSQWRDTCPYREALRDTKEETEEVRKWDQSEKVFVWAKHLVLWALAWEQVVVWNILDRPWNTVGHFPRSCFKGKRVVQTKHTVFRLAQQPTVSFCFKHKYSCTQKKKVENQNRQNKTNENAKCFLVCTWSLFIGLLVLYYQYSCGFFLC